MKETQVKATSEKKRIKSEERSRIRSYKMYYESKISCLSKRNLHVDLVLLACKDAPVEKGDISSNWRRDRYIKKCLKFYQKKLNEITKQEKKLEGKFSLF
jgi:hypothetical protein